MRNRSLSTRRTRTLNDKNKANHKLDINDVNLDVDYEELLFLESYLMHEVKRKGVSSFVEEYEKNIEVFHEAWDELKFCFLLSLLGCFDKSFSYPEEVRLDKFILNPYVHYNYVMFGEQVDVQELYDKSLKTFRDRGFLFDRLSGAI